VVYGDRVFVTSHVKEGKKALLTLCFDRGTGKELWRHDFGFGVDQRTHEKSNLAVNTPAVTEDALYVAFGNADIARYSHHGKLVWVKRYIPPGAAEPQPKNGARFAPVQYPQSPHRNGAPKFRRFPPTLENSVTSAIPRWPGDTD
jgi:hypothetical protein